MYNLEQVSIASHKNETAQVTIKELGKRVRFRYQTNLNKFRNEMLNKGLRIVEVEFVQYFKDLDKLGVGTFVGGRTGGKPARFIWNYNLKQLAHDVLTNRPKPTVKAELTVKTENKFVPVKTIRRVGGKKEDEPKKPLTKPQEPTKSVGIQVKSGDVKTPPITAEEIPQGPISLTFNISPNTRPEDLRALFSLVGEMTK